MLCRRGLASLIGIDITYLREGGPRKEREFLSSSGGSAKLPCVRSSFLLKYSAPERVAFPHPHGRPRTSSSHPRKRVAFQELCSCNPPIYIAPMFTVIPSAVSGRRRGRPTQAWSALPEADVHRRLTALGLHWDRAAGAIICLSCKYALQTKGERVSRHLGDKHRVEAAARKGLSAFMKHLSLPDPNQLDLLRDHGPPHPQLATHAGAACRQCNFRSTSLELVRRHLSKTHRCKGDRKNWLRDSLRTDLRLQSWTSNGARGFWIIRDPQGPALSTSDVEHSPGRRRHVAAMHEQETQRLDDTLHQQSSTDTGIDDLAFTSNWMRRTRWAATFHGVDRQLLQALCQAPSWDGGPLELGLRGTEMLRSSADDERRLSAIGRAVDHFFDQCEDTARNADHFVRCWLRSHIPGRPYKAPFELPGRRSTIVKYRSLWKSLVYFAIRLYRLDGAACAHLRQGRLSGKQRRAVSLLWAAAVGEGGSIPTTSCSSDESLSACDAVSDNGPEANMDPGTGSNIRGDPSPFRAQEEGTASPYEHGDRTCSGSEYEDSELSDGGECDSSDAVSSDDGGEGLVPLSSRRMLSRCMCHKLR